MEITINLTIEKSQTRLAGFPYGEKLYKEQVESHINYEAHNIIVIPPQIEKVASSFVQGFFAKLVEEIGYVRILEIVEIKAATDTLVNDIWSKLPD